MSLHGLKPPPSAEELPSLFETGRTHRIIEGLISAQFTDRIPTGLRKKTRLNKRQVGAKLGIAYEKRAFRHTKRLFPGLERGKWIWFLDANGTGLAQPDAFDPTGKKIILLEMKHTQTREAYDQLLSLYRPLLESIFWKPVVCIQVCRNMKKRALLPVDDATDFQQLMPGRMYTWHLTI